MKVFIVDRISINFPVFFFADDNVFDYFFICNEFLKKFRLLYH